MTLCHATPCHVTSRPQALSLYSTSTGELLSHGQIPHKTVGKGSCLLSLPPSGDLVREHLLLSSGKNLYAFAATHD